MVCTVCVLAEPPRSQLNVSRPVEARVGAEGTIYAVCACTASDVWRTATHGGGNDGERTTFELTSERVHGER